MVRGSSDRSFAACSEIDAGALGVCMNMVATQPGVLLPLCAADGDVVRNERGAYKLNALRPLRPSCWRPPGQHKSRDRHQTDHPIQGFPYKLLREHSAARSRFNGTGWHSATLCGSEH